VIGPGERHKRRLREAVRDYGQSGEQRLAQRLQPLELLSHYFVQASRHRDLSGGVHRRR